MLIAADTCLHPPFQAVVSEEDGMESIAHRFLSAAVKVLLIIQIWILTNFSKKMLKSFKTLVQLDRKPSKCVVFEDDPRGITAAHNCTMMAIGLIGAHRA